MIVQRTQADWDRLAAEVGRLSGDLIVWMRTAEEAAAERDRLRAELVELDRQHAEEGDDHDRTR